jgi:hypothetical protein
MRMIQTFTKNDLLRYAYNETSPEENQQIEDLLAHNTDWLHSYLEILDMQLILTEARPPKQGMERVFAYSANHSLSGVRAN